jgi:hypothetical protein
MAVRVLTTTRLKVGDTAERFCSLFTDYQFFSEFTRRKFEQWQSSLLCYAQPNTGQGRLSLEVYELHNNTSKSVGLLWEGIGPLQRPQPENTQRSQQMFMIPGGIRIRSPSGQAAAHPLHRTRDHFDGH